MSGLLDTRQAAEYLGLQPATLEQMRWRGDSLPFVRLSARAVRYRREDLERYVQERLVSSTSDTGGEG